MSRRPSPLVVGLGTLVALGALGALAPLAPLGGKTPLATRIASALDIGDAAAQSRRYPPPPTDYDHDVERTSVFWERTLHPNEDLYKNRIAAANRALRSRDKNGDKQAAELLQGAIELAPDRPLAHWMLARLRARQERWADCAASLLTLRATEPDYEPSETRAGTRKPWALDYEIGVCTSRAGEYERAITHFKRILGRGHRSAYLVHWRLGESYMALGRLREAIAALREAGKYQSADPELFFTLAVAYDRDERVAESDDAMREALRLNGSLSRLDGPRLAFAPATDRLYYLGLANAGRRQIERAIAYFRHYVHDVGEGPWVQRARDHLAALSRAPMTADRIFISGTDIVDSNQVANAITAADSALQACTAKVPGVLFRLRVTAVAQGRGRQRGPRRPVLGQSAPPPAGVKASIEYSSGDPDEAQVAAQQCLESAVDAMSLPRPKGDPSRHVTISFFVIHRE